MNYEKAFNCFLEIKEDLCLLIWELCALFLSVLMAVTDSPSVGVFLSLKGMCGTSSIQKVGCLSSLCLELVYTLTGAETDRR